MRASAGFFWAAGKSRDGGQRGLSVETGVGAGGGGWWRGLQATHASTLVFSAAGGPTQAAGVKKFWLEGRACAGPASQWLGSKWA
jgi:hypothetical protein